MSVQHKSLEDEILFLLGRNSTPLDAEQIYERVELADDPRLVRLTLCRMRDAGKIAQVAFESRHCYKLAAGVAVPAPAGKAGRPTGAAPAAAPAGGIRPADMPTLGDPVAPTRKKPGPKPKAAPADHVSDAGKVIESSAEDLADAILAKTREKLRRLPNMELIAGNAGVPVHIHIHIEQVDFHLGGL